MSELKSPRLLAAAKEFNIGQDTLIEFLVKKGFNRDDLKPTAKLLDDQYHALQQEFQGDKVAKNKADQVEIPKGAQGEGKKKKDEEEITFRKEEKKPAPPKVEPKPVEPVVEAPKPEPVVEKAVVAEVEHVKIDAPELEGTTVVNKIDLSAIDSSTRPKKSAKKKDEKPAEEAPAKPTAKGKKKTADVVEVIPVAPAPVPVAATEEESGPTIENIKADKLLD